MTTHNQHQGRDDDDVAALSSFAQPYRAGVFASLSVPAAVLFMTFIGYGALTREAGFSLSLSLFTTITTYALPGQVVLVDQVLHGASVTAAAFAVTLTAIRLLPLTASFLPLLHKENIPRWLQFVAAHFIAVTVWVEAMRHIPKVAHGQRFHFYLGICTVLVGVAIAGTIIGYNLAAAVPPMIQAALLFLTPIYFFLSLITIISGSADKAAIILGVILGPLFFYIAPGLDLLLTGLIGGTLAYGGSRWIWR